jgi:beta-lactamase class A
MSRNSLFMGASQPAAEAFDPRRRQFLGTLALGSAALLLGGAGTAAAAGKPSGKASGLQGDVLALLGQLRTQGLIGADERSSWAVYDITTREKLVSINEDTPRQAASMIKPFVAQAFFFTVQDSGGKVRYTDAVRETMERMIRRSSNPATNEIMSLVSRHNKSQGPAAVEKVLKRKAPTIFRDTRIVETIPASGQTYRNRASAHDYNRFLTAMWDDQLPYAAELRSIMALPNRDRIASGVDGIPDSVKVYDKTGSTAQLCGDMGIVDARDVMGRSRPYTFIGIIERPSSAKSYGTWIKRRGDAIRTVSDLVYREMKARHGLV